MATNQANVIRMPGTEQAPKAVRSKMDTLLLTIDGVDRWKKPPFQREQRMSKGVRALVLELRANGGVISGVITLGVLNGDTYLIDGQHRIAAFRESSLEEGFCDVRICHFDSMGEMGEEFVRLNSALVRMKNEDILRGLEGVHPPLASLRRRCSFIGYDRIRAVGSNVSRPTEAKTTLSVAVAIRVWFGSETTPTAGPSSTMAVKMLDESNGKLMADFFSACYEAWGGDKTNFRLWGVLNLAILAWLWRRVILGEGLEGRHGGAAPMKLTREQFVACLMALSADSRYVEWLRGRGINSDRDRSPCFWRIKDVFAKRLADGGHRSKGFPGAEWQKS